MAPVTHSVTITLGDGTPVTHAAEMIDLVSTSDGAVDVMAACCGKVGTLIACPNCEGRDCASCRGTGVIKDEDTRSHHAFYDIAAKTDDEMLAEIQGHVEKVANHHARAHKARVFLASLKRPKEALVGDALDASKAG